MCAACAGGGGWSCGCGCCTGPPPPPPVWLGPPPPPLLLLISSPQQVCGLSSGRRLLLAADDVCIVRQGQQGRPRGGAENLWGRGEDTERAIPGSEKDLRAAMWPIRADSPGSRGSLRERWRRRCLHSGANEGFAAAAAAGCCRILGKQERKGERGRRRPRGRGRKKAAAFTLAALQNLLVTTSFHTKAAERGFTFCTVSNPI